MTLTVPDLYDDGLVLVEGTLLTRIRSLDGRRNLTDSYCLIDTCDSRSQNRSGPALWRSAGLFGIGIEFFRFLRI